MNEKAIDIFKIKGGELGIVNINNMVPTPLSCLTEVLPLIEEEKYRNLIINQTTFLNDNKRKLLSKVKRFMLQYDKDYLTKRIKEKML